ncbi:hypothetical protein [Marinobacter sp.]|uniref:hypothetical protein n=1 Tax=Marinobacter sp. TaxID=50741 RepID=UPI002B269BC4|nr:hypothetical protein [Marinobacter sp.]
MITNEIHFLLLPFSQSIFAKAEALKKHEVGLRPDHIARFRESISEDIKKCSNFVVPEVSDEAHHEATKRGLNLFEKNWHDQPAFDPGRKIFHLEHVQPVSAIRAMCLECDTEKEVHYTLQSHLRVAWILKKEDAELSRLGYRSKRKDPDAAYAHANIRLRKIAGTTN